MSDEIQQTIIILGLTLSDATSEYRRLLHEEPERVTGGKRVKITSTALSSIRSLEGLRCHDYSVSWAAPRGKRYAEAIEGVQRSFIRSNPEGSKLPECP